MTTYYKATRPDGTDFRTGTVLYEVGGTVSITGPARYRWPECCTNTVLHASTVPGQTLVGGPWPCRLFEVTGEPVAEDEDKRGFRDLTVVAELEAWRALGPQGRHVAAFIDQAEAVTTTDWDTARGISWDAAFYAAWDAARDAAAARAATRDAAQVAAWDAARGAAAAPVAAWHAARVAVALVVRDLIGTSGFTQDHYDTLTRPWRTTIGPVHPDDANLGAGR
jgi:hypothetical protein